MISLRPFLAKNSRRFQKAWVPLGRAFSSSAHVTDHDSSDKEQWRHGPVTVFTEDETMIRDTVRQWAREELLPIVRDMDNECALRPEIVQSLFQQGKCVLVARRFLSLRLLHSLSAFSHTCTYSFCRFHGNGNSSRTSRLGPFLHVGLSSGRRDS
jgi:hypothetical protein